MIFGTLEIKTAGRVCFPYPSANDRYLCYDVPFDSMGIPVFPVHHLAPPSGSVKLGLAKLEHCAGIMYGVTNARRCSKVKEKQILSFFTEICEDEELGKLRVLREGLLFKAPISAEDDKKEAIDRYCASVKTVGYTNEQISGAIRIRVRWDNVARRTMHTEELPADRQYHRLNYRIQLTTPLCVFSPYDYGEKCKRYIPGDLILNYLKANLGEQLPGIGSGSLRCSNLYPCRNGVRGIPAPASMGVEKLDKDCLHSRLSKDPEDRLSVQLVGLGSKFITGMEKRRIEIFESDLVRIFPETTEAENLSGELRRRDAISDGFVFSGYILGSDADIRSISRLFSSVPIFCLGNYANEGYGEVLIRIDSIEEAVPEPERLYRSFDVLCCAPLLLNDTNGMETCIVTQWLSKIEQVLHAEGRLEIVNQYLTHSLDYRAGMHDSSTRQIHRCIGMGSCLRLRTKDGGTVDLSLMNECFLGNCIESGYGEMQVFAPFELFYRTAENVECDRWQFALTMETSDLHAAADTVNQILLSELAERIHFLALIDRSDSVPVEPENILPVLRAMSRQFFPQIPDEELLKLYGYTRGGKK